MSRRILLVQGHPDPDPARYCRALAAAYAAGAAEGGHALREVDVAALDFPLLRTAAEWQHGALPEGLARAQADIAWAEHIVIVFPLWLGTLPALLKAFLEQVMRPGFAVAPEDGAAQWRTRLGGRSARVVVTMGMPALVFRLWFFAHGLKSLERNILRFVGIAPVRETLIGLVEASAARRERELARLRELGRRGA